ncbi:LamG-like jellyroll fold domain-containing protein [Gynuella sunshinyii]|nr:LamG-like jellyroll fold domain-containing protein [Gynuella sunshinyii]
MSLDNKARRRLIQGLAAAIFLPSLSACRIKANESVSQSYNVSDKTVLTMDTSLTMNTVRHPGLLHTEADFTRMREKVEAHEEPWLSGWAQLNDYDYTSLGRAPNPQVTVSRGSDNTGLGTMKFDMESTYQIALCWKVTGDTRYADLAVWFLNEWSATMTTLTGNADRFLAAGIYGYQWANAAEIMRTYSGWASDDIAAFQNLLSTVFYPLSSLFLAEHNGTEYAMSGSDITNYWANWDLCNICSIFAIGVFCDRLDFCNKALDYFLNGRGNGAAAHIVYMTHPGYLGQWQESGRDQGHSSLGISLIASLCEMAWNQGVDLYGYWNNRVLAGAEYVAASNLSDYNGDYPTLPYAPYSNRHGTSTGVSGGGRPSLRPGWEIIYNHYVNRKGLSAPWASAMAARVRPEWRDRGGDEPSFGTLTMSREPFPGDIPPSGLSGVLSNGQVLLSWWGSAYATSYNVKRGTSALGPFDTIANVTDPRTYTDAPGDGIWFYSITGITPNGETDISNVVRMALPFKACMILPLDGSSDDTSGDARHATLNGGASWGDGRIAGTQALRLDGESGYLSLPDGILTDISDFTICAWVNWQGGSKNQRIFDFGTSDIVYAALILESDRIRFAITGTRFWGERCIYYYSALPTDQWVHIAITLSGEYGRLYVNGSQVATDDSIKFAPFQMGYTRQNWLGRSQYSSDPKYNGFLQDFRLYSGALDDAQIAALAL